MTNSRDNNHMPKHWSHCSVYAVARAISEQHNTDWDQAFRFAWHAMRANDTPPTSVYSILVWMEQVKHVPIVPERVLFMMQANLRQILRPKYCATPPRC